MMLYDDLWWFMVIYGDKHDGLWSCMMILWIHDDLTVFENAFFSALPEGIGLKRENLLHREILWNYSGQLFDGTAPYNHQPKWAVNFGWYKQLQSSQIYSFVVV